MSEEVLEEGTEEAVVEEISGIIYHKSKILLKAITRKDKLRWFDQLMIKRPTRDQIKYLDNIINGFEILLNEFRIKGVADEKKVQEIGKMILKAPEMTSQIGKLIAHIVSTLEETDIRIEQTLDSSIKKNSRLMEKKLEENRHKMNKELQMDALIAHLQDEVGDDDPATLVDQPKEHKSAPKGSNIGLDNNHDKFDSFKNKFCPNSIINEDYDEDQEADTLEYQNAAHDQYANYGFVSGISEPELPGHALQARNFHDRAPNPEIDELNFFSEEDEIN